VKQENEDYLVENFPELFADYHKSAAVSCMGRGFEVNDGWFLLIKTLSELIKWQVDHNNKTREESIAWNAMVDRSEKPGWWGARTDLPTKRRLPKKLKVKAAQVKEKFGTLQFSVYGANETIEGYISMAEAMSAIICEDCGLPGTIGGHSWIRVQCPACRDKQPKMEVNNEN